MNENEIIEICGSLRSGAAAGYDGIPMNVVKQTIDLINYPLRYILNLSLIRSGIVPESLKIANVIPLFKSGDHDMTSVNITCFLKKILEKVVYNCLLKFLNKFNILSDNQYGFRKHHSTAYALTHMIKFHLLVTIMSILWAYLSICREPLIRLIIVFYLKN